LGEISIVTFVSSRYETIQVYFLLSSWILEAPTEILEKDIKSVIIVSLHFSNLLRL